MKIERAKPYKIREYVRKEIEEHDFLDATRFVGVSGLFERLKKTFPLFDFEFLFDTETLVTICQLKDGKKFFEIAIKTIYLYFEDKVFFRIVKGFAEENEHDIVIEYSNEYKNEFKFKNGIILKY